MLAAHRGNHGTWGDNRTRGVTHHTGGSHSTRGEHRAHGWLQHKVGHTAHRGTQHIGGHSTRGMALVGHTAHRGDTQQVRSTHSARWATQHMGVPYHTWGDTAHTGGTSNNGAHSTHKGTQHTWGTQHTRGYTAHTRVHIRLGDTTHGGLHTGGHMTHGGHSTQRGHTQHTAGNTSHASYPHSTWVDTQHPVDTHTAHGSHTQNMRGHTKHTVKHRAQGGNTARGEHTTHGGTAQHTG